MDKVKTITPLSHGLPKTGQITEYVSGDDGTYEAGWWLRTLNANNRTRFIKKELVSGEAVILDLVTGLMWPYDLDGKQGDLTTEKNFADAIAHCEGWDFGGYDDWRLPNVFEMMSLFNAGETEPAVYKDIFYHWGAANRFITATTSLYATANYQEVSFQYGLVVLYEPKTNVNYFLPVRSI